MWLLSLCLCVTKILRVFNSHISRGKQSSVHFSAQTSLKCVGNTNTPILNQTGSCGIARHRPRDPASETVIDTKCLKVMGNISIYSIEEVARNFCPHQTLHSVPGCACITETLLFSDCPTVPTFKHLFHDRKC